MKHDPTLYEPPCMFCEIGSIIGSVIGAGVSLIGGAQASGAAEDAAGAQVRSAEIAAEVQREGLAFSQEVYDTSRADLSPWRATGGAALHTMSDMFIPGGQPVVRLQNELNDLRARRAVLARTGGQPATPVQEAASSQDFASDLARVRADRLLLLQNSPGGDGGGGGDGGPGGGDGGSGF